jgi:hypothetical protein
MEKRQHFQQLFLGKLDICMKKTETRSTSFINQSSINSMWVLR